MASSSSTMDPPKVPYINPSDPNSMEIDMWYNTKYKDFQILIGDRRLCVHKCVLAARSPVFAAMLTSGLTETQTGQLIIQDFDVETVVEAIIYCYCHRLKNFPRPPRVTTSNWKLKFGYSASSFWSVLTFGHKYDIQHLVTACLGQIKRWRNEFDNCEKKFFVKSAVDLGCDQILDQILIIFGVMSGELVPDSTPYPALGHALLVQDATFKDLKIICDDDGTEFAVHKYILALRSPVFAQIIENLAVDKTSDTLGRLTINKIKTAIVVKAVKFLYIGFITDEEFVNNSDLLLGLLEFADRFKVVQLVSFCLQKINHSKNDLDKTVVLTYVQTAFNFESKKILQFIMEIFGTLGFDPFDFKKASNESYWN